MHVIIRWGGGGRPTNCSGDGGCRRVAARHSHRHGVGDVIDDSFLNLWIEKKQINENTDFG